MFNVGPLELLVILIVALVVVGPEKLPDLARTIGRAMRELRKIQDDLRDTIRFEGEDTPQPAEHQVRPVYDEPSEARTTEIQEVGSGSTGTEQQTDPEETQPLPLSQQSEPLSR